MPIDVLASTLAKLSRVSPKAATVAPRGQTTRPADPTKAARYETLGVLGEGGMGVVERARDNDLVRDVAVKHLRPDAIGDGAMLEQFLWEARVTAYLDHPNIVPVHDIALTDAGLFFTMKLVHGRTLEAIIERTREGDATFDVPRRLRAFMQICNAIAYAHSRGVLHRDIKPANVMIGEFGEVLVTDWGVASPLDDRLRPIAPDGGSARSGGTPLYMSPEQTRGDELDARSDIYALGAMLYELVALEPIVDADSLPALTKKVTSGDLRRLADPSLGAIVAKATALDPRDRYADPLELAKDVEIVLDGRTPGAEHASIPRRFARFYFGHDRALARMRVWVVDVWIFSAGLIGLGIGVLAAARLRSLGWWFVAIGIVGAIPPTYRWLTNR